MALKSEGQRDFYHILGVEKDVSDIELRQSFRSLATRYHPDKCKDLDVIEAKRKFQDVYMAYTCLRDPKLRKTYDEKGIRAVRFEAKSAANPDVNASKLFESLFFSKGVDGESPHDAAFRRFVSPLGPLGKHWHTPRKNFVPRERPTSTATPSTSYGNPASPFDISSSTPGNASSESENTAPSMAPDRQRSVLSILNLPTVHSFQCSLGELYSGCKKRVSVKTYIFEKDGAIINSVTKSIDIPVKPGWRKGTKITFPSAGNAVRGSQASDIILQMEELSHPIFTREGNDLLYTASISLAEALTGVCLHLQSLDERDIVISITDVVTPETIWIVSGEGMPLSGHADRRGDLKVSFKIRFPRNLLPAQKIILSETLKEGGGGFTETEDPLEEIIVEDVELAHDFGGSVP